MSAAGSISLWCTTTTAAPILSMEKGTPGERAFVAAFKVWTQ
jgi:hypothetical protein